MKKMQTVNSGTMKKEGGGGELNKQSLHIYWGGSLLIIDDLLNGSYGAVLVVVCKSSDGLNLVVVPNCNSGTRVLSWQDVALARLVQKLRL